MLLGAVVGALLIALSLAWRFRLSQTGADEIATLDWSLHLAIVIAGLFLALLCVLRPRALLVAAPLGAISMSIPQLQGLPFLREFAYMLGFAGMIAVTIGARGAAKRKEILRAWMDPVLIAIAVYLLLGFVTTAFRFETLADARSRVMLAHLLIECIVVVLLFAIVAVCRSARDLELLVSSLAAAGVVSIGFGVAASALPFFVSGPIGEFSYFGMFYFCRVQLSFSGPVHYSAFVAAAVPLIMFRVFRTGPGLLRTVYLTSVWLAPLAVAAGGSRPARLALIVSLVVMAVPKTTRALSISVLIVASLLFVSLYQYRCLTDVVAVHAPQLLPPSARSVNGGILSASQFFTDDHRSELRADALKTMFGTWAESQGLLGAALGHGPGLAAYDRFGIGGHTVFIDLIIDRGVVGGLALVFAALFALWRTARSLACLGSDPTMTTAVTATAFPLLAAGVAFDVRTWAFMWVYSALFVVVGRLGGSADLGVFPRDRTDGT
jgi:hypothetical protein